jgi:hypothetical protein
MSAADIVYRVIFFNTSKYLLFLVITNKIIRMIHVMANINAAVLKIKPSPHQSYSLTSDCEYSLDQKLFDHDQYL